MKKIIVTALVNVALAGTMTSSMATTVNSAQDQKFSNYIELAADGIPSMPGTPKFQLTLHNCNTSQANSFAGMSNFNDKSYSIYIDLSDKAGSAEYPNVLKLTDGIVASEYYDAATQKYILQYQSFQPQDHSVQPVNVYNCSLTLSHVNAGPGVSTDPGKNTISLQSYKEGWVPTIHFGGDNIAMLAY